MGSLVIDVCRACKMIFYIKPPGPLAVNEKVETLRCHCGRPYWVKTSEPEHDGATGFFAYGMSHEQYGRWVNLLAKQPVRA